MEAIRDLFFIAVVVVYIVDISCAVDSLKTALKWILTKGKMSSSDYILKPFDCSLCMIWWTGIIYLLCTGNFTLPYLVCVCLLSAFAGLIKTSILLIEDIITTIIQKIYKFLEYENNNL